LYDNKPVRLRGEPAFSFVVRSNWLQPVECLGRRKPAKASYYELLPANFPPIRYVQQSLRQAELSRWHVPMQ
jgi:hypothetical protein